jgi:pimeloyl-ACP methyl ester carboxylesterase
VPRARVNGVELYYESCGKGLPLVFAHGGGGSLLQWAYQVPHFSERYRVVTFDNRGHGRSESPQEAYSIEVFAEDILGLFDALSLERVVLIGLTMGAMTALRFALDHPDRLLGMVLVSASEGGRAAMRERFETSAQIAESHGMEMLAEGFCSVLFSPWFQQEKSDFVLACRRGMQAASPEGYARSIRALAERQPLRDRLSEIRVKTLVVIGEDDVTEFPLEDADLYARGIPDAKLAKIRKAGHLANIEQADVFNSLLDRFLDELRPR